MEKLANQKERANPIENGESFKEKLLSFELEYCAKLWEKKIPFPDVRREALSFEEIINNYSDISRLIHNSYEQRTGKVPLEGDQEFKAFNDEILSTIHQAYNSSPQTWISSISTIIKNVVEKLPEHRGILEENKRKESNQAGLLRYDVRSGFSELKEYGISEEDKCILIHLDALYTQPSTKNDEVTFFSSDSFKKLAEDILTTYPETKAIIAESWLIDSPIGKRIFSHIFPSPFEHFYHGDTFWGQFYNQHGELNQDRMKQFLETGKPPFTVKGGFLLKGEFLEKYLPISSEKTV